MNKELLSAIEYLSKEKGVAADVICESLEAVLITAYKKEFDGNPNAVAHLDKATGDYSIVSPKTVVETVADAAWKFPWPTPDVSTPIMKSAMK